MTQNLPQSELLQEFQRCSKLASDGDRKLAEEGLNRLLPVVQTAALEARARNDLGVIASVDGRTVEAFEAFRAALNLAPEWSVPKDNLRSLSLSTPPPTGWSSTGTTRKTRVAIVSLLFSWPSTGGGTVHTAEAAQFLSDAGYEVRHFSAEYEEWGVGAITEAPPAPIEVLRFTAEEWTVPAIQARFRSAVDSFKPDWVIVTDSWNSKPILAEALKDYPFFLRIAAQECLCPLNNVRLLFDQGDFTSCSRHQFATPADCCRCVYENGRYSGSLHKAEREFVNYGSPDYDTTLRWTFAHAEAVLVVNPLIGAMISPYAKKVCVIPSGFDAARFVNHQTPVPLDEHPRTRILFAGLVQEWMKGFAVLHEACRRLWNVRQDFELLATADPPGQLDPWTRYVGWKSQAELPSTMAECDIVACPTIAEEALGRTAVEAMGVGRPVLASRLGGLQFTVLDEATGLLCDPGDPDDLSRQLTRLLDSSSLRERLGRAGRERFDQHYTWDVIIERHYRKLLGAPVRSL